jgi:hypothetical protein
MAVLLFVFQCGPEWFLLRSVQLLPQRKVVSTCCYLCSSADRNDTSSVLFNYSRNGRLSLNCSPIPSPRLWLLMCELLRLYMYKRRVPTGCSLTPRNGALIRVLWPCNRGLVLPRGDSKQCYYEEVTPRLVAVCFCMMDLAGDMTVRHPNL